MAGKRAEHRGRKSGGDFLAKVRGRKLLIGMVHLPPLPGSPGHDGRSIDAIAEAARRDARAILDGGLDGWILENFGDVPFFPGPVPSPVIAVMTRIALALPASSGDRAAIRGVNVLRNDASAALAVAFAAGLDLIRVNVHAGAMVTDQGIIEGRAAETLRERALLGARVAIAADVLVKHAAPLGAGPLADPAAQAKDLVERALADALIVSGPATGAPTDAGRLRAVRRAVPAVPLLVGSGATDESIAGLLEIADGAIVGTWLKEGGDVRAPVDPRRVRSLVRAGGR